MIFKHCFVFDLDETLVYVKGKEIFIRPYSESILNTLSKRDSALLILWSSAEWFYVHNVLVRLNWSHYFDKILTRDDCDISFKAYGEHKSCLYIKYHILKTEQEMFNIKYILIDDLATKNETSNRYDYKINIVPYMSINPGPDLHLYNAINVFL